MIKNYWTTALRNFWKNKMSSVINVLGLTIGLTCCLLIALYIQHELSYDNFEKNGKRIARVIMEYSFGSNAASNRGNFTSIRVAKVFPRVFPEVQSAIRMTEFPEVIHYKDKLIDEKHFMYADSTFFDMFSFHLLQGNPRDLLSAPYDVVLTQSTAKKYFGEENPVGQPIHVGTDSNLYKVTGVTEDPPSNSQIKFDFLASFSSLGLGEEYEKSYFDANYTTYLLLSSQNAIQTLQSKLPAFMKKEMQGAGATINFYLEPFDKIHLHSPYEAFEPNTSIAYIYVLAAVALLILVIAAATYINLSTARSIERAKEVGVRKVIGAEKSQVFWQFIGESLLICLVSVLLSLLAASLLVPAFDRLSQKPLETSSLLSLPFISFSLGVAVIVSLLAGSYPALVLSGFQPIRILKGSFKNTHAGRGLRQSLIVFQFVISVFLIVSTFIMQNQLYYIQHRNLGYDRSHVLVLPSGSWTSSLNSSFVDRLVLVKEQFKQDADVLSVSRCVRSPVEGAGGYNMRNERMPESEQIAVYANPVDEDYIATTGLHLIAGTNLTARDIQNARADDPAKRSYHFILNESAARELGWTPAEAIGKKMFLDNSRPGYVRGVVQDYNFQSLHQPIKSLVLFPEYRGRELLVKISGIHMAETIAFLESKWKTLVTDRPFEYRFMDEDYNSLYDADIRLGKVMNLFSTMAIILACLGLFGLSSYSAQQRLKEIGIRKILGASLAHIVVTLSGDFVRLTLAAMVVAFPLSWWAMSKWLEDFSYRTGIDWKIFILAGGLTFVLAVLTVSVQALRAALANPVNSLRTE